METKMLKRRNEWTEEEKLMVREGIIVVIGAFIIVIADFYLLEHVLARVLNLKQVNSTLFAGIRTLSVVFYVIGFFPGAILCELADSRSKKRSFTPQNILILMVIFGEFILITITLLTLFDVFFQGTSFLIQVPLVAVSISISLLVLAATSKIERINDYVKKAFA